MSYGAARQLLMAGLSNPTQLLEAAAKWPDNVRHLHATIACHAYEFILANETYMKAQQEAMDLAVAASQARIHLHNAIVSWQAALEKAQSVDAVDPSVPNTGTPTTRDGNSSSSSVHSQDPQEPV